MHFRFVTFGSSEWNEARELRHSSFFQPLGLSPTVMDDAEEANATHLVALIANRVVAYGRLFDFGNGEFHLSQLVVAQEHRGEGIGSMVLECLISRARTVGATTIKLSARLSGHRILRKRGIPASW